MSTPAVKTGILLIVEAYDGADWQPIAAQKNASLKLECDEIDTTCKGGIVVTSFDANADLMFLGPATLTVVYLAVAPLAALGVTVVGNNINIELATNSGGVITSTANAVMSLVNGDAGCIAAGVTASLPTGSSGVGIIPWIGAFALGGYWKTHITGNKSWSVDCNALYAVTDAARVVLDSAITGGTPVRVHMNIDGSVFGSADNATVKSNELSGNYNEAGIYNVTFSGTGNLT